MLVAIPLFERFTALDAVGPYEVLQRVPSIDVVFVGHQRGEVRSDNGMLGKSIPRSASSPRPGCPVGSTWRCGWLSYSSDAMPPKPAS